MISRHDKLELDAEQIDEKKKKMEKTKSDADSTFGRRRRRRVIIKLVFCKLE